MNAPRSDFYQQYYAETSTAGSPAPPPYHPSAAADIILKAQSDPAHRTIPQMLEQLMAHCQILQTQIGYLEEHLAPVLALCNPVSGLSAADRINVDTGSIRLEGIINQHISFVAHLTAVVQDLNERLQL